ncbi:hypothetical protein [Chryseobacterium foetidum]|nr:hypothetical protein [Chryseobacterium foetidum]
MQTLIRGSRMATVWGKAVFGEAGSRRFSFILISAKQNGGGFGQTDFWED